MLNSAIRYQPVLSELRRLQPETVLEVGGGAEGLALFWHGSVVGVDVQFKRRPLKRIRPVLASALALPFGALTWPVVVSCDMLEHIPPGDRSVAVAELVRVCERVLVLTFPSGAAAANAYRRLGAWFDNAGRSMPVWLTEHLRYGLPDADTVAAQLQGNGWSVSTTWHESAAGHAALMWWESRLPVQMATYSLMRIAGQWLVTRLSSGNRGPPLRALLVAQRLGNGTESL
jgi:ubiquinone/menaquinone biosynthesis C-methylase UbiE